MNLQASETITHYPTLADGSVMVPLSAITVDKDDRFLSRQKIDSASGISKPDVDWARVREFATKTKAGEEFLAIQLFRIKGKLYLGDGLRRYIAHVEAECSEIHAFIFDVSEKEAIFMASMGNHQHGTPPRNKKAAARVSFNAYVAAGKHRIKGVPKGAPARQKYKSYRVIAQELKHIASRGSLNTWMHDDHPKVWKRMGERQRAKRPRPEIDRRKQAALAEQKLVSAVIKSSTSTVDIAKHFKRAVSKYPAIVAARRSLVNSWEISGRLKMPQH